MLYSAGDETTIGRIKNVMMMDVGQGYQLGRYPINYHTLGRITKSYISNNVIVKSYSRGIAISSVEGLTVSNNILYKIKGHGIFTETGAETRNVIHNNMVSNVEPSYGLQHSDQTPAAFFITNPNNEVTDNHAKCSSYHGFWYYLRA